VGCRPKSTAILSGQQSFRRRDADDCRISLMSCERGERFVGVDWTPAQWAGQKPAATPIGAVMFRVHDEINYLVAGYGLGGYPFSAWKVEQNAWTLLASANIPRRSLAYPSARGPADGTR